MCGFFANVDILVATSIITIITPIHEEGLANTEQLELGADFLIAITALFGIVGG